MVNEAWAMAVEVNAEQQRTLARLRREHELMQRELTWARECLALAMRLMERHPRWGREVARALEERRRAAEG